MARAVLATSSAVRTAIEDTTMLGVDGTTARSGGKVAERMRPVFVFRTWHGIPHRDLKLEDQDGARLATANGMLLHPSPIAAHDTAAPIRPMNQTSMQENGRRSK